MRLLFRILFRFYILRLIIGALLLLSGIVVGIGSHQAAFKPAQTAKYSLHLVDDTYYYQLENTDTYYSLKPGDFTPNLAGSTIENAKSYSFIYEDGNTSSVSFTRTDGTDAEGTGYPVEELELGDANGQNMQVFKTAAYTQNPKGTYENDWIVGGLLIAFGALILGLSIFFKRRQQKRFAPIPGSGAPGVYNTYGQPQNPGVPNAYGQPQYGQPQYPGVPNAYGQPQYNPAMPNAYGQPQYPGAPNEYVQPQNPLPPTQYAPPSNPNQ